MTKQALPLLNVIFILVLSFYIKPANATTSHPASRIHRGLNEDSIHCTVYEIDALALSHVEENISRGLSCASDNHGPTVFLDGNSVRFFSKKILSGVTTLTIPTHLVSGHLRVDLDDPKSDIIVISHGDEMRSLRGHNKKHSLRADYEGTFGILVVRVSDSKGHTPTHSADEISKHVFTDNLTMTSQYRACSNDKLQFIAANGSDVVNGVLEVTVDIDLASTWQSEDCVVAADDTISSSSFDLGTHTYTMYICPDAVDFGPAAGVADVNGKKSWYSDRYGSMPFVQMHEIGHNLGFHHSGEGTQEYGDPTGVMGGIFKEDIHWGRMCFNAAKIYSTEWYSQHHRDVSPHSAPYSGNIVDVNSVSLGRIHDRDDVVVRVQTPNNAENLYLMLYRLEGITSDILPSYRKARSNHVNIVSQEYSRGVPSKFEASLASGEEFIRYNWARTGKALHIKVCSIANDSAMGGAHVIAYLEGETSANCYDDPSHSAAQKKTSPSCADSTLKMFTRGGAKKGCSWVAESNTEQRCKIPGVASHCPMTCGTCIICVDSGKRFEMNNDAKDIKSCSWVKRFDTAARCKKDGVASTCRATCGTCQA